MRIGRFGLTGGLALVVVAGAIGCSRQGESDPSSGTLYGKVTLDSKPVLMGSVVVHAHRGVRWAEGEIAQDGTYVVENAPEGPVYIFLKLPPLPPAYDPRVRNAAPGFGPPGGPPTPTHEREGQPEDVQRAWDSIQEIPAVYFSTRFPQFRTGVKPGEKTELDLNMSSKVHGPPDDVPGGPPGPIPPP